MSVLYHIFGEVRLKPSMRMIIQRMEGKRRQGSYRTLSRVPMVLGQLCFSGTSKFDSFCSQTTVSIVSNDNKTGKRNNLWLKSNSEFSKKGPELGASSL